MKLILLLLSLCLMMTPAIAQQQITAAEYFFDTDPGVGQGTAIPILIADDSVLLNPNLIVPPGLSVGEHYVYLRTYADSAGYKGTWSMVARQQLIVMPEITEVEYFIDTDPGAGQGTPLSITSGDTVMENLNITIPSGISVGHHYLYLRSKSSTDVWGLVQRQSFYVPNSVVAAEYFIDTDPGIGNGTPFSIPSGDTVLENVNLTIPINITTGQHYLYTRTRSNTGTWSHVQMQTFFVPNSLVAAEYFLDNDPGPGNGIPFSITPGDTVDENQTLTLPATIPSGLHQLYTRTKSADGVWGLTQRIPVFVKKTIVAAEYFFDTDPGVGNGYPWPVSITASDTINSTADIQLPCLTAGRHLIYVRSQDDLGIWSHPDMDTLYIQAPTLTLNSEYPGAGPYGTPVRLHASGGEGPYLFNMDGGSYVEDSLFLAGNGAAVVFNVTDTCGHSGTVLVNTPEAPIKIATTDSSSINLVLDGWRYWVYLLDGNGDIVAAVKDNGENLGTVNARHLKHSGSVRQFPVEWESKYYLDRNWVVKTQYDPMDSIGLRLYALNTEYNALATVDPTISDFSDLRILKYNGSNEDLSFSNNNVSLGADVLTPDSLLAFTGSGNPGYWLDFKVSSFSEFYQSSEPGSPLSIQSLTLSAIPIQGKVQIVWDALSERDLMHYTVQRSVDGKKWKPLGKVAALNEEHAHYSFDDVQPEKAWNYYRLAVTDNQKVITYSTVVGVNITESRSIAIFPNPARNEINIEGTKSADKITLMDATGREVYSGKAESSQFKMSVNTLSSGLYLLRISNTDGTIWVQKVEILKN